MRKIWPLILLVLPLIPGCDPLGLGDEGFCTAQGRLTIEPGPPAVFSWNSSCRVTELSVRKAVEGGAVWRVDNRNGLSSPITYSRTPGPATEKVPPEELIPGVEYLVILGTPGEEDTQFIVAMEAFVAR